MSKRPHSQSPENPRLANALRLRETIVTAVTERRFELLRDCPRLASRLEVSKQILEETGLGVLLADASLFFSP